ncbi:hypothetical protein ANN_12831 [Periplaneta americana]|uniref:Uncharacterized protein n=1 Tax=Periplaneta americana TaxID=6978 RepID=A0ABQ8THN8_PERAM|nr:hypothetical protein ANN_12831 [Periplaneta americana]
MANTFLGLMNPNILELFSTWEGINAENDMQPMEWDLLTNPVKHLATSGYQIMKWIPNGINDGGLNVSPTRQYNEEKKRRLKSTARDVKTPQLPGKLENMKEAMRRNRVDVMGMLEVSSELHCLLARRDTTGKLAKLIMLDAATQPSSSDHFEESSRRYAEWEEEVRLEELQHLQRVAIRLFDFSMYSVSHNAYRVLVGRPEGKRPLGRPRRRWEDNIKMDLRDVGYDDRDWINLAQDRDQWRAYHCKQQRKVTVLPSGGLKRSHTPCVVLDYVRKRGEVCNKKLQSNK